MEIGSTRLLIPPAPRVHAKPLSTWRMIAGLLRDPLTIYSEQDFERSISSAKIMGRRSFGVNEPSGVRHILTSAAIKYRRPVAALRSLRSGLGDGLLLSEGEEWRRQRRMLAPVFSPAHVGALLRRFQSAGAEMLDRMHGRRVVNLSSAFAASTLDALLRALFSMPANAQGADLAGLVRTFINGPGRPNITDALARREGDFAILGAGRRRFRKRWLASVDALVQARREQPGRGDGRDLLDVLLATRDAETGASLSLAEIRDQAATMLVAGFETTARLLFWTAYLLALDQEEQAAVAREIDAFAPARVTSLADLENWPKLRSALLEALRLYPPVGLLVREARERDEVLGERIEPGDMVWISPWTLHRHRTHWEHPTAFMPSRFADQPHPWTQGPFMPFGGGPRICIGASFALAEAQIIMALLLERFRIDLIAKRPVMPVGRITTAPDHEPEFILSSRSE